MKEIYRLQAYQIVKSEFSDLMGLCLGKNIINNPNIVREDDVVSGDVVFYESSPTI